MNSQELIEGILLEKDGVIITADALNHQISKPFFFEYVKQMGLRKDPHLPISIYRIRSAGSPFVR